MKHLLELRNIKKSYGNKVALNDISLKLHSGEVLGIFGPNGSGKTTLFSIIIGDQFAEIGSVFLDGDNITNWSTYFRARNGISYLPQESSVFRELTVEENIVAVLELYISSKDQRCEKLESLLGKLDLLNLKNQKTNRLSGGERRRVEIARALAIDPKFLLLDEPLAAIDPITIQEIKLLIGELKNMGIGIIVTDHNVKEMLDIVDYAHILYKNRIIASGSPEVIIANPEAKNHYFGDNWQ